MSSEPAAPSVKAPDQPASGNLAERVAALLEVLAAFALVHVVYRSFKHFTDLGRAEGAAGLNFSPGLTMILFTTAVLLSCRRNFKRYGLTLEGWRSSLNIGLVWGVLLIVGSGLVIWISGIHFHPLHPPNAWETFVATTAQLLNVLLLLWFLLGEKRALLRFPPLASLLVLFGLLSIPLIVALRFNRPVLHTLLMVLWAFFGAGFGEEIFFRGYIQSRVNQVFGRSSRFMGIDFGWGLIVSSALFGFIHVLNPVDYFSGRFDFAWTWWLPQFVHGLLYGFLREKTRSILAGGIIHGLADVAAVIPALLR